MESIVVLLLLVKYLVEHDVDRNWARLLQRSTARKVPKALASVDAGDNKLLLKT